MKSLLFIATLAVASAKPNIVFIITDDQGYGDLACHGNPIVKTPHLDKLHSESSVLTDYHVAPTCSPTRASLLTGHWTNRTGVWHTVNGRSMLRENEVTIATMLKGAGYQTGHFGKWHLGDNYPYRPEDRGFTEVYRHGGGGVGQTPDHWNNAYFDGSYTHNGKVVPAKGFCTDVFFENAHRWIKDCAQKKEPFFAYITTNAPHGPLHCPQKYLDLYKDQPKKIASFFGMISNIDGNVGKTRSLLKELGIEDNTIFIFTTDNGTAYGNKIFNAGMSGKKGSPLEGGHRVPFFLHWPDGKFTGHPLPSDYLSHAIDIVPTLLDLCHIPTPEGIKFDGHSLRHHLGGKFSGSWEKRFIVTDSQRVRDPIKWRQSCVLYDKWRLINGKQLYDISTDPGQKNNLAKKNPNRVGEMRAFYDAWWAELEPTFSQTTEIILGHPNHPVVELNGHDWIQKKNPPWNQQYIRTLEGILPNPEKLGHWAVRTETEGVYEFTLRRWPKEANTAINASLPPGENVPGSAKAFRTHVGKALKAHSAVLRINGQDLETQSIVAGEKEFVFTTHLKKGSHQLAPYFQSDKNVLGVYYCSVTKPPKK